MEILILRDRITPHTSYIAPEDAAKIPVSQIITRPHFVGPYFHRELAILKATR